MAGKQNSQFNKVALKYGDEVYDLARKRKRNGDMCDLNWVMMKLNEAKESGDIAVQKRFLLLVAATALHDLSTTDYNRLLKSIPALLP